MDNKKYLPLKIFHLVLMVAAFVISCIAISKFSETAMMTIEVPLRIPVWAMKILAIISGMVYLIFGYKKEGFQYYRAFMVLLTMSDIVMLACQSTERISVFMGFANIISIVIIAILAVGKDLGKRYSYLGVIILLLCRLVALALAIYGIAGTEVGELYVAGSDDLSLAINNVILAGTVGLLVFGKYADKAARGRN